MNLFNKLLSIGRIKQSLILVNHCVGSLFSTVILASRMPADPVVMASHLCLRLPLMQLLFRLIVERMPPGMVAIASLCLKLPLMQLLCKVFLVTRMLSVLAAIVSLVRLFMVDAVSTLTLMPSSMLSLLAFLDGSSFLGLL